MSEKSSSTRIWLNKIKTFVQENKNKVGIVGGAVILLLLICVITLVMGHNSLVGTWKEVTGSGKIIITKDTVDFDSTSYSYKLSDDKKHIILTNGGDSASTIPFTLKDDVLTFEGTKYYRKGSSAYKSASSSSARSSSVAEKQYESSSKKAAKAEAAQTKLINKYKRAYREAQDRLTNDIAKKLNGNWQYTKTDRLDFMDASDILTKNISFDQTKLTLSYKKISERKYDKEDAINKNTSETKEGKASFKLTQVPAKYVNISSYGTDSELSSELSEASSKEVAAAIKELKDVTLDNYFDKMHDLYGGYSDDDEKHFTLSLSDTTGDLHSSGSDLYVNFPKSDSKITQISLDSSSFSDDDDYTKVQ